MLSGRPAMYPRWDCGSVSPRGHGNRLHTGVAILDACGQSSSASKPAPGRVRLDRLSLQGLFSRLLMAGVAVFFVTPWMVVPTSANDDFMGVLKGSPPLSPPFINTPASYDISSNP